MNTAEDDNRINGTDTAGKGKRKIPKRREDTATVIAEEQVTEEIDIILPEIPKRPPNHKKQALIAVGVLSVILIGLLVFIYFRYYYVPTVKVELSDYLELRYEGLNGYATAYCELDEAALNRDYGDSLKWLNGADRTASTPAGEVCLLTEPVLSEYFALSNGDVLDLSFECDPALFKNVNIGLQSREGKITVSGLPDPVALDPFEHLEVEYYGYNGKGEVNFAGLGVRGGIYSELPLKKDYREYRDLSNGDEISFEIEYDEALKPFMILTFGQYPAVTEKTITVSGLPDMDTFDPFRGIEVIFGGGDGSGYVSGVVTDGGDELCRFVNYYYDNDDTLHNGDKVKIYVDEEETTSNLFAAEHGKIAGIYEKEFTVKGLTGNYTSFSDIPQEKLDAFSSDLIAYYREVLMPEYEAHGIHMTAMDPLGYDFLTEAKEGSGRYHNILYCYYRADFRTDAGRTLRAYIPVFVPDVGSDGSGKCTLEYDTNRVLNAADTHVKLVYGEYTMDIPGCTTEGDMRAAAEIPGNGRNSGMKLSDTPD